MDKISLVLIIIIIILTGFVSVKYYLDYQNFCTTEPLIFAAQKYEKDYGHPATGSLNFLDARDNPIYLQFNSTGIKEHVGSFGLENYFVDDRYDPNLSRTEEILESLATQLKE